jgi:hypothetical protein
VGVDEIITGMICKLVLNWFWEAKFGIDSEHRIKRRILFMWYWD